MNSFAVLYSKDLAYFVHLEAQFIWDMESTVEINGNFGDRQQMGTYATALAPEKVAALKAKLLSPDYRSMPLPQQSHQLHLPGMPDLPSVVVGLWDITQEVPELRGFEVAQVPAPLLPVVADLEAASNEVLQHPKYVVEGTARWDKPAEPTVGDERWFSATLKNVGAKAIRLAAPGFPDPERGMVPWILYLSRIDAPAARRAPEAPAHFELKPENLREDSSRKRFWSKDLTTLGKSEELRITFKKRLHLTPGTYRAQLVYFSTPDAEHDEHVGGSLRLELPPLTVTAPR